MRARFAFPMQSTGRGNAAAPESALRAEEPAPPNGIFAVFPHARHLALRVRLWIDFLKHSYGDPRYWNRQDAAATAS